MKLWVNKGQYGYYSTIKGKNKEQKELKTYLDIAFWNCKETEGQIEIKDGFFAPFENKKGIQIKLIIKDYELLKENMPLDKPVEKQRDPFESAFAEFGDTVSTENDDFLD